MAFCEAAGKDVIKAWHAPPVHQLTHPVVTDDRICLLCAQYGMPARLASQRAKKCGVTHMCIVHMHVCCTEGSNLCQLFTCLGSGWGQGLNELACRSSLICPATPALSPCPCNPICSR